MWSNHKANHCFCNDFKIIRGSIELVLCTHAAEGIISVYKLYSFSTVCGKTSDVFKYIIVCSANIQFVNFIECLNKGINRLRTHLP